MGKTILQSKVFWVFLILIIGATANSAFSIGLPLTDNSTWVIVALSFVAFVLRLFTSEEIGWSIGLKVFYKSKVFWVAVLIIGAALLNLTGVVKLPLDFEASWIATALGIILFILRLVTKEPIVFEDDNQKY
jgi:uncharacterized membrane protein YhdT